MRADGCILTSFQIQAHINIHKRSRPWATKPWRILPTIKPEIGQPARQQTGPSCPFSSPKLDTNSLPFSHSLRFLRESPEVKTIGWRTKQRLSRYSINGKLTNPECIRIFDRKQPNQQTWAHQASLWQQIILSYCRYHRTFKFDITGGSTAALEESELFHNRSISSWVGPPMLERTATKTYHLSGNECI
jgi:hypothetical protein